jgi:hypothetical protein
VSFADAVHNGRGAVLSFLFKAFVTFFDPFNRDLEFSREFPTFFPGK